MRRWTILRNGNVVTAGCEFLVSSRAQVRDLANEAQITQGRLNVNCPIVKSLTQKAFAVRDDGTARHQPRPATAATEDFPQPNRLAISRRESERSDLRSGKAIHC